MSKATKIWGWVLLIGGVLIIVWTLYSSYNIFTGKEAVPEIFKVEKEITSVQKSGNQDLELQLEEMIGEQLEELIPSDVLPKILNFTVWAILAGILIFGGAQISNLGIKLINK